MPLCLCPCVCVCVSVCLVFVRVLFNSGQFNVVLTTYTFVMRDKAVLRRLKYQYIIIDEGHRMKNSHCKFSRILGQQYYSRNRILLTGTPLQNNLPELWSLLNFLLPKVFNSVENFDTWFSRPFQNFGGACAGARGRVAGFGAVTPDILCRLSATRHRTVERADHGREPGGHQPPAPGAAAVPAAPREVGGAGAAPWQGGARATV